MSGTVGPVGQIVAANVRRLREARRMSLRELAGRVQARGGMLSVDAISKIENGRPMAAPPSQVRRVDVDDLLTLAAALGVAPSVLLASPNCVACWDAPPPGFTCNACGTEAGEQR